MNLGRIKIWFDAKTTKSGLFFRQFVFWWNKKNVYDSPDNGGIIRVFHSKKKMKKEAKGVEWFLTDYGYSVYGIWRFRLTIKTPSFLLKNLW